MQVPFCVSPSGSRAAECMVPKPSGPVAILPKVSAGLPPSGY